MIFKLPKLRTKGGGELRSQLSSSIAMAESCGKPIDLRIPEEIKMKHTDILKDLKALKYVVSDMP